MPAFRVRVCIPLDSYLRDKEFLDSSGPAVQTACTDCRAPIVYNGSAPLSPGHDPVCYECAITRLFEAR